MGVIMNAYRVAIPTPNPEHSTSLKNAFRSCNPELLLDVLLDCEAGWGISYRDIGASAKETLLEKLISTLALMQSVGDKILTSDDSVFQSTGDECGESVFGREGVLQKMIVPCETFQVSDDGKSFTRQLEAKLLDCSKIKDAFNLIEEMGGRLRQSSLCLPRLPFDHGESPFDLACETGLLADIDILEDEPWIVSLQRRIWLPHIFCERERYCILASVFWAITYKGFFGIAAEEVLNEQCPNDCFVSFEHFDGAYEKRMSDMADVLNYNGWVDSIEALACLCEAA